MEEQEQVIEKVRPRITQKKMKLAVEDVKQRKYRKLKKRQSELSSDDENPNLCGNINFNSLQVQTLRRYKKFFRLKSAAQGLQNKKQLIELVRQHFPSIQVQDKKEILAYFIYNVKHSQEKQEMDEMEILN